MWLLVQHRSHVSWLLARVVGRLLTDPGPGVSRPDTIREAAALKAAAQRTGGLAVERSGPGGLATTEIAVVGRPEWSRRVAAMANGPLDRSPLEEQLTGPRRTLAGISYGPLVGISFVAIGRDLLGQYDSWSEKLMLVTPSVIGARCGHDLDADDL